MQYQNYLVFEKKITLPIEELKKRHNGYNLGIVLKRSIDLFFALGLIFLICSWLFPIIGLLIKLDSKGPIFFRQPRVGLNNGIFDCWKLRTMYIDSDANRYQATEKEDLRVTKVGIFLRRTNLDELPQIINLLLGDMALVGPRPQSIPFYNNYKEIVEELDLRHVVKPGITGWAQVKGLRGDSADEQENRNRIWKRFDCDMWYIENWSIALDLTIIYKTLLIVIRGDKNAF